MNKQKIPGVILRRILLTFALSVVCIVVGAAGLFSGDTGMAILSFSLSAGCVLRTVSDYRAAVSGKIIVVEGYCTVVSAGFHRFQHVLVTGTDGTETRLQLQKGLKIIPGKSYRFYFRESKSLRLGVSYLDSLVSVGAFFGMENKNQQ